MTRALHRYIERRHRFVRDHKLGFERQRPRDTDALALTAGELVRILTHVATFEPDALEQCADGLIQLVTL